MLIETLGVFATALFAPSGLLLLGVGVVWRRRLVFNRGWFILWVGTAAWFLIPHSAASDWRGVGFVLSLFSVGLVAATLLKAPRKTLATGLSLALAALLSASAADLALSLFTWQAYDMRSNLSKLWHPFYETVETLSTREWVLNPASPPKSTPTSELRLSFEARLRSGAPGWNWHRSMPEFKLEQLTDQGQSYTHVRAPLGDDPYLMRTYTTPEPVGGERFRATVVLRADRPLPAEGNRGIWLQTSGETLYLKILPVSLNTHWQTFFLEWTPPVSVQNSSIHLVLNDFDGVTFDVKEATLQIFRAGVWASLDPPSPTGVNTALSWEGHPPDAASSVRFVPTSTWQPYDLTVESGGLAPAQIEAVLTPEPGLELDVRRTVLEASGAEAHPRPHIGGFRSPLWFGQPNLAGHTVVTVGLVLLASTRSGWLGTAGLIATVVCVGFTGSRAAWLAALLGLPWLLWLACRAGERPKVFGTLFAAGVLFLVSFGLGGLGRLQMVGVDEPVNRPQIWATAWAAFGDNPVTGVGTDGFTSYWRENRSQDFLIVTHAHNLWLQFAAAYGLPGLVAVLWLTGGFLLLAWTWGRWRGLALVVPVFVMNIFDYTFFYSGVLFPLLLGMNALRQERADAFQAAAPPPAAKEA